MHARRLFRERKADAHGTVGSTTWHRRPLSRPPGSRSCTYPLLICQPETRPHRLAPSKDTRSDTFPAARSVCRGVCEERPLNTVGREAAKWPRIPEHVSLNLPASSNACRAESWCTRRTSGSPHYMGQTKRRAEGGGMKGHSSVTPRMRRSVWRWTGTPKAHTRTVSSLSASVCPFSVALTIFRALLGCCSLRGQRASMQATVASPVSFPVHWSAFFRRGHDYIYLCLSRTRHAHES